MLPSKRGLDIGASPIRSLLPYAREAKKNGKHIYHLNIGQPDIETPSKALEVLRNLDTDVVAYGPSEGLPALRDTVAQYYNKFDGGLQAENIYVTTGASEAILFALLATCDANDEVIIPEPFYANYLGFAHLANVNIKPITTRLEDEFALPNSNAFESLISSKTKAIILCNPGNPTGQLYTRTELERIAEIVKKHNIFLIVDEVYREFCYDDEFHSVLTFPNIKENVIVIDSVSKVFSACGARVGYLISKNNKILDVVNKYAQLRLCPPYHGQMLALACYEDANEYVALAKKEYALRRDVLYNNLTQIKGLEFYKPKAAFYNIIGLPIEDANHFCKWLLTDFSHKGASVMLAPADGFYANKSIGKSQARLAYILNRNDLNNAMECLSIALDQYPR